LGLLEWSQNGKPKAMPAKQSTEEDVEEENPKKRQRRTRYCYVTTFRTAKALQSKPRRPEIEGRTFDDVLAKALAQPFWD
jgi:hypothetical protein